MVQINLPGSGKEIEITVPQGMHSGETMEFLVPNSYLLPPSDNDVVIIQRPAQPPTEPQQPVNPLFNQPPPMNSTIPPYNTGGMTSNVPPPAYSGFSQHAPPQHQQPEQQQQPSGGGALDSNTSAPLLIPDYSQSARSYSSDQMPKEETLLTRADTFFKNMFGQTPATQPNQLQQQEQQLQQQRRASAPAPFVQPTEPYVPIDESTVTQLMEMGFSREAVTQALTANRGKFRMISPLLSLLSHIVYGMQVIRSKP